MREYPENVIIMGNPAKVVMPIPSSSVQTAAAESAAEEPGIPSTAGADAHARVAGQGTR